MFDREKIIKGLETCYCPPSKCEDCPYNNLPDEQSCNDVLCVDALTLLREQEVRELTIDEWRAWKNAKNRDPICMIYKQDDTHTPIWVLDPNKVHEPALLMGEIKLFTGKPTFEQCKAVKWND